MTAEAVSQSLTKILCSHGGSMEYKMLKEQLKGQPREIQKLLSEILQDKSRFALRQGDPGSRPGCVISPNTVVAAKTAVRLCKKYPNETCHNCRDLHLCKFFVYGNCRYSKEQCRNIHDIKSGHNLQVLKRYGLQNLDERQLSALLLQNDSSLLPEVCVHYNKGSGKFGSCTYQTGCSKLHICLHTMRGNCKFGNKCNRSHKFDGVAWKILKGRGLSEARICQLQEIYHNIFIIKDCRNADEESCSSRSRESSVSSNSEGDSDEICLYYISKYCSFKEKCMNVHFHLPYKWEVFDGHSWSEIINMEQVEKDFCNPENIVSSGSPSVDYQNMTTGLAKVRRLSTVSSVTKKLHFSLTTKWIWYWKDEFGKWIEYGKQVTTHNLSSVTSDDLEEKFLANCDDCVTFTAGQHEYTLSFKDMTQQNQKHKTKREVRRRPQFISQQDAEKIKRSSDSSGGQTLMSKTIPDNWDKSATPEYGYKLVQLAQESEEFKQVLGHFQRTMPNATVSKINRIQNQDLWEMFQIQKEQMKKKSGDKYVDERLLFHGTEKSLVDAICHQNFDWRICGVHGTSYGKGSYFARDASYSHSYSNARCSENILFVARVLVGKFIKGSSSYNRPPSKDGSNMNFYDSCVDNVDNPSIFVIFDRCQIYPSYVIEYSMEPSKINLRKLVYPKKIMSNW
ncbi:protein mono-ADP-ribosyltransferase PARP12-like isoform X1 [Polypterus senegalus]|uniref:protein mono-ADP-ribosyltransferase PARP12-like isoform X1 n=1 Tax=Polypterus senegalus TaxID=55291 RepID=UPI001964F4DE|nr:protein mono-ADP-ribosyltransferase PARP12-like isoform X1 [Polypterus senegalus]